MTQSHAPLSARVLSTETWGDRIQWMAGLVVASFVAVLLLPSQSAASYPSYLLALLMLCTFGSWRDIFSVSLLRWIVLLLSWLSISVFWSDTFELREAVSVWIRVMLVSLFIVAVAECQFRGQLQRWMMHALTLVGAAAALSALLNFLLTQPADGRLNGMGQLDTHVIAALIYGVALLFVLRYITQSQHGWRRIGAAVVALTIVVCIYLSDSRNAWVSVSLGVMAFVLAHVVRDARQFIAALVAGGLLLAVLLLLGITSEPLRDLILPRGDSFRLEVWGQTLERLQGHMLFGRGILSSDDVVVAGYIMQHAHSMYLSVLSKGGLVALLFYIVILVQTVSVLISNYQNGDAKLALSILVVALFAHLLDGHELVDKIGSSWFLIWLPVAVAVGLSWSKPRDLLQDAG
ncbi:MAG: O-antigen ligase family protein [Pseudomonadota bacterium]